MDQYAGETPRQRAHHVADAVIARDLATELDTLRQSDSYQKSNHAAVVIAKQTGLRVVLIALKRGGQMEEHHTDRSITVQGIAGNVKFTVGGNVTALTPGTLLAVAPGLAHSVAGVDESAFLLTMGGADPAAP